MTGMAYLKGLVKNGENILNHLLDIEKLPEIQSLIDYMQSSETFKKYFKEKFESGVLTESGRELSTGSRRYYITTHFIYILFMFYSSRSKASPKFSERDFRCVYSRMESHLLGELEYSHFIPLHSFTMANKKMKLAGNIMIREILAEEKAHLVNLGLHFTELTPLKYVAEFHGNDPEQADRTFENLINALKLFKKGAVSYGIMSSQTYNNWSPTYTSARFLPNAKIFMFRLPIYELNAYEMRFFGRFYKMFDRMNEKISRQTFMQIAIRRFGSAENCRGA